MANLIQRTNCKGVDCSINFVQEEIYFYLLEIWGAVNWDCFPRVYKTRHLDDNGAVYYKPEYMDGNFEYNKETLFNDKVDVTSFFLKGDRVDFNEGQPRTDVSLIFSCDITKLYPSEPQKADEHMHNDIASLVTAIAGDTWELSQMHTGVEDVYREFKKDDLNWSSTSHRHLVRFDFDVRYSVIC